MVTLKSGLEATVADFDNTIDTNLSTDEKEWFLNIAYSITDPVLDKSDFSSATISEIEAEVAADAASSKDPRIYRETVGDSTWRYQRVKDETDHWAIAVALSRGQLAGVKERGGGRLQSFGPGRT